MRGAHLNKIPGSEMWMVLFLQPPDLAKKRIALPDDREETGPCLISGELGIHIIRTIH